ncbi:MAG: hypothetical protein MdMp024_1900 [Bacteroidales bacterium]
MLREAAQLLHDKNLYPAVAHGAYYSCFQLMKHIWLHTMGKTEDELTSRNDSHAFLINEVGNYKKRYGKHDGNKFNNKIVQLKRLRVKADYEDKLFDYTDSSNSLFLSNDIIPILKQY